ncbi:MAG: 1-acyl-sn-glycerol-3-phosphate acyltransferase [Thermotogota bacterium]|nr:1-acyl-sn-glycerol-3-phosphate acyltransferase [Thermotogota bacterium]
MLFIVEAIIFWILIPCLVFFYSGQDYVSVLTNISGYAFISAGVLIALYSSLIAYIQNGKWSLMLTSNDRLIISGPYRYIRHPVSTGYMIYLTGIFFLSLSYTTLVFLLSVMVFIITLQLMQEKYSGKKVLNYDSYRRKVPAFVPFPGKKIPFDYSESAPLLFVLMNLLLKIVVQIVVFPFITVRSKEKKGTPVIFAIQHQTHYDGPAMYYALTKYFRPVGTALYVEKLALLRKMGTIPVKRYERDMRAMRDIMSTLSSKFNIIIAPEAARSWDGERLCIRKEIWKLFKKLGVPIIPVKFNGAQRLWPRWSNILQFGHINIEFGEPINPNEDNLEEKIKSFLDKEDQSFNKRYRHYLGINRLLWRCPSCGTIGSIKGRISSFFCNACNKSWKKPNVYEVIELHKKIRPDNMDVNFPVKDEVTYKGRKVEAQISKDRALIGNYKFMFKEFRSSSIEANKENIFGLVHDTLRFLPAKSALMWKEIIDHQVVFEIGNNNYHTYYWDENC